MNDWLKSRDNNTRIKMDQRLCVLRIAPFNPKWRDVDSTQCSIAIEHYCKYLSMTEVSFQVRSSECMYLWWGRNVITGVWAAIEDLRSFAKPRPPAHDLFTLKPHIVGSPPKENKSAVVGSSCPSSMNCIGFEDWQHATTNALSRWSDNMQRQTR